MRVLALSDIHGNMSVVRRLRAQEANAFDLVVVAGDIGFVGGTRADEVLAILATFGCTMLYVLGNHDSQVAYDRDYGLIFPNCTTRCSSTKASPSSATAAFRQTGGRTP